MNDQEAIGDEEIIYRRIPITWFDAERDEVKPDAFKPRSDDTSGISVTRSCSKRHPEFLSIEDFASSGSSPRGYFVACLNVGELRQNNIDVVPKPLHDNLGHAEIPQLTYANKRDTSSQELMVLLAHKLVDHVHGPFLSSDQ